jgi:hypothetical protein
MVAAIDSVSLNLGCALGLAFNARVERNISWPTGRRLAGFTF